MSVTGFKTKEQENTPTFDNSAQERKIEEKLVLDSVAKAASTGDVSGMCTAIRRGGNLKVEELVKAMTNNMSEPSVQNLDNYVQTALSDQRNITNTNSREFVVLTKALLEIQSKNKTDITDTSQGLKAIADNPALDPELRASAKVAKEEVEYARFRQIDRIFEEIKNQKLKKREEGDLKQERLV
ncbi:MAG: hypothetical protein V1909_01120 [Candidatus Micrarchaeota archaeon]